MPRKAAHHSLRSGFWVLILAVVTGCGQPTIRPLTTQSFARLPSAPPVYEASADPAVEALDESVSVPQVIEAVEDELHDDSRPANAAAGYEHAWDRMRSNFQLPQADHARLDAQIAWYQDNARSLRLTLDRSDPYLAWILDQLEAQDMPAELALLPVIESGYQPQAYSSGHAAGLWQFVPATGTRFGLKQNWWYDGRRDLVDSTRAALAYLNYLHDHFDGDWLLALAAYNAGEGRVAQAIERNRAAGKPTDFWHLDLPPQTRIYVPKLLALRDIVADPEQYSINLPEVDAEAQIALVDTPGQIDLSLAAKLAGIPVEDVQRLNPGFNHLATAPNGPHRLVIPIDAAESFAAHIANLPADQPLAWERHRIARGETLAQIARRYDTSVALLRKANNLSSQHIRAGNNLLIPVGAQELAAYRLSPLQRTQRRSGGGASAVTATHVVRSGDTLWGLARRYNLSVQQLTKLNAMQPDDTLRPGTSLRIGSGAMTARADSAMVTPRQTLQHTVRRGDTLTRISERYRVSVDDLRKWNNLKATDYLQPGQTLSLPVDLTRQADGRDG